VPLSDLLGGALWLLDSLAFALSSTVSKKVFLMTNCAPLLNDAANLGKRSTSDLAASAEGADCSLDEEAGTASAEGASGSLTHVKASLGVSVRADPNG